MVFRDQDPSLHEHLLTCHRRGWLHAELNSQPPSTAYIFPSPLHRWFIERKLCGSPSTTPPQNSLFEFSKAVIHLFSPVNLANDRRVGPGFIQRPPEAQYQDEFYRCCHALARGSTVSFPEFGTTDGRVDFYIPSRKWAIELLREGNDLAGHYGRSSKRGKYIASLPIDDFIVLDFRVTRVVAEHKRLCPLLR